MRSLPTILVVDDDEVHRHVAHRAIAQAGLPVEVRVAADGAEALRLLHLLTGAAGAAPVVVVLLDIRMPGMSGWEVLERIRGTETTRHVPVVIVSSSNRTDDVERSYRLGANSYVVKRHDAEHPGAYLAEVAHYWLNVNVTPVPRAGQPVRRNIG